MGDSSLSTSTAEVGDVVAGKYRVERLLGRGAMGVVVAARHLQLDQLVAIKLVVPDAARDDVVVERFVREGRAAAKLRSDHAARVLDVGRLPDGSPYMVLEYLEGADLGEVLATEGPLDVATACDYLVQACDAVAEAHALGIVHRDLKPENLYRTTRVGGAGLIKVLDFGISKQMTSEQGSLTQTHTVMGSPLYMAPEQLRSSRQADPRSDVWGLGVVLYELLTCRCPFEAESLPDLCVQITREPPRPIEKLRGDVPEELRGVLARCLEKDPSRRFADAAELAAALRPFLDTPSRRLPEHPRASRPALAETLAAPATTASTRAPRRMTPWITAAIAVAVAATWTGATLARRGEPPAPGLSRAAIDAALTSSLVSRDVPPAVLVSVVTTATEIRPPPAASAPRNTVPPRAAVRVAPASRQEVVQAPAPPADDIPAFR